jgi:hypothetical protein
VLSSYLKLQAKREETSTSLDNKIARTGDSTGDRSIDIPATAAAAAAAAAPSPAVAAGAGFARFSGFTGCGRAAFIARGDAA